MALSDYGQSFSPLRQGPDDRTKPGGGSQTQEAIRTISTRIPRITQGGRSLAPSPLLNAPGGMGVAAPMGTAGAPSLGLEELIRRLFGLLGGGAPLGAPGGMAPLGGPPMGGMGPMSGGMGSAPPPRVIPGDQGPLPPGVTPVPDAPPVDLSALYPGVGSMGTFNPGQQGSFPGGPYRGPFGG